MMNALIFSLVVSTPNFPGTIGSLSGKSAPDCTLCHQGGVTSRGTVTTPFGASMMKEGMVSGDADSVRSAWSKLEAAKTDSDKDGVSDVDELKAGRNPNVANATVNADGGTVDMPETPPTPTYGCSQGSGVAAMGAALLAVFAFRGRHKQERG